MTERRGDRYKASNAHEGPAGVTARLERPEIGGYRDLWSAAPRDLAARFGIAQAVFGPVHCVVTSALPGARVVNHVLGMHDATRGAKVLGQIEQFYAERNVPALVAVPEAASAEELLVRRRYTPDYAWIKFERDVSKPVAASRSGLVVQRVEPRDAEAMGRLVVGGFGLPGDLSSWFANLVGRPGWHCLGAYDGRRLVACGTVYVDGEAGWLTWDATDPVYRGRGAQKDLLAARIEFCRQFGLRTLVTETGEPAEGRPDASYRNIMGADFSPRYRRPFWRAPRST